MPRKHCCDTWTLTYQKIYNKKLSLPIRRRVGDKEHTKPWHTVCFRSAVQVWVNGSTLIDELFKNQYLVYPHVAPPNCFSKFIPSVSRVGWKKGTNVLNMIGIHAGACMVRKTKLNCNVNSPFRNVATLLNSWSMSQCVCPTERKLRYIWSKMPQSTKDLRYANKYLFLFSLEATEAPVVMRGLKYCNLVLLCRRVCKKG